MWTLNVPQDYFIDANDDCYIFVGSDGYGVLQISDYICNNMDYELDYFSGEELDNSKKVQYGIFTGYELQKIDSNQIFWRKILLKKNQLVLLVTYNAEVYDQNENIVIDKILSSLAA